MISIKDSLIKGFITVEEKPEIKCVRIITRLFSNRHFAILKYKDTSLIDNMLEFNHLNRENKFGETWFVEVDKPKAMFSFSVGVVPWGMYKSAIFSKRVDSDFKKKSIKDRYGSFVVYPDSVLTLCSKSFTGKRRMRNDNGLSDKVKNTLKGILFDKREIDELI